jgi:hypothetical protein
MATPYFDTKNPATLLLLAPTYRNDPELPNVAALAEAMVIGWYTMNPPYFFYTAASVANVSQWIWPSTERGGGEDITTQNAPLNAVVPMLRVYLTGYKQDASDVLVDPNLKAALTMAIAEVVTWTLTRWKEIEPGVASVTQSGVAGPSKSRVFRPYAESSFPPDWNMLLEPFNSKPVNWGL